MAIKRMPISKFVAELEAALNRKDGYIMGAKGQSPKKWSKTSWWFTQYSGDQKTKALYWRENAKHVWDCNGLAEGIYENWCGVNINTKARYNYSGWCSTKGSGMVPVKHRKPGVPVFWGKKASTITHVAYLYKPVDASNPSGDWYIIEARGVMYGVVMTKLFSRKPNFWGIMDKYFDYADDDYVASSPELGERTLKDGMEGEDVKDLQEALIKLGYDCGSWGADGDFGDATELALMAFQRDHDCDDDGVYGPATHKALTAALEKASKPVIEPKKVTIVGGQCWIRSAPNKTSSKKLGVAKVNSVYPYGGETKNGWILIEYENQNAWVSDKYGKLITE